MVTNLSDRDYLGELLASRWFAPPVALWRAVELRAAAKETYPQPLLDLGCGDGQIASILFGAGGVSVGVDPWAAQVKKAALSGAYRQVQQADGYHLPFAGRSFSTVFSNSVLEHIPDIAPVIREVGRVLISPHAPGAGTGGKFVFTVPSDVFPQLLYHYQARISAGDSMGAIRYISEVDARLAHHHYHTPDEWSDLLEQGGMELEKHHYYMPERTEQLWDRMNAHFGGTGNRSLWTLLASPRLRHLGFQRLLRSWVVGRLGRVWRPYYDAEVAPGEKGGGLLIVGRRVG
jgi:SAM-dependent methyltransferase